MNINGLNRNSTYLKKVEKINKSKKNRNEEKKEKKEEKTKQYREHIIGKDEETGGNLDLTL